MLLHLMELRDLKMSQCPKIVSLLSEVTELLEGSTELMRTLEQLNMSLREGKHVDVNARTLESLDGLKAQLEGLLLGRKWRNAVERIWSFGPRRSGKNMKLHIVFF